MPLDATDTITVRNYTGAAVDEISDAVIDAIYDSTAQGNSDMSRTTYYVLLRLLGIASIAVDKSAEVDSLGLSSSQRFDHIRDTLLPLWGSITGLGVSGLALTMTSTFTYRADSLQTEAPTYDRGALTDWVTGDV